MRALQDHDTVSNVIHAVVAGAVVIRSRRNEERDGAEMILGGNAFQARAAPANGNARSPSEDRRVAGTMTSVLEAECSRWRE